MLYYFSHELLAPHRGRRENRPPASDPGKEIPHRRHAAGAAGGVVRKKKTRSGGRAGRGSMVSRICIDRGARGCLLGLVPVDLVFVGDFVPLHAEATRCQIIHVEVTEGVFI